ncbi:MULTISPECIES: PfkB family carbohydrate kinase [Brucella/Ochrobactrum group]|uniref:PfkB family carbohydrate kinase n=1 Tax=Brucella/Ochrobactrum group TaxID=2826938 RepID=UPI00111E1CAD|nr:MULTISPECIES: PfkB family carbohydrate kinase [Brucella/Ochrobactrum group]
MTSKILCVGALTMDTILRLDELPHAAGKYLPREAVEIAAGMASSAASAIARLGGDVGLWASAGIDPVGDRAVAELEAEGIDCSCIRRLDGARTAFSSILVDAGGERIIVPFYDRRLADPAEAVPPIATGAFAAVMADVRWPWAAETALRAAREVDIPAILDADTAPVELLEKLLPLATHIVASEPAAISVAGTADLRECVRILANRYDVFTAVTAGADGCYWVERAGQPVSHVAGFKVDAVDTLAAGDVFHGAFAQGLVEGKPMTDIIRFANAAAAIKCARFGGRAGSPSQKDVVSFMESGIVPAQ